MKEKKKQQRAYDTDTDVQSDDGATQDRVDTLATHSNVRTVVMNVHITVRMWTSMGQNVRVFHVHVADDGNAHAA